MLLFNWYDDGQAIEVHTKQDALFIKNNNLLKGKKQFFINFVFFSSFISILWTKASIDSINSEYMNCIIFCVIIHYDTIEPCTQLCLNVEQKLIEVHVYCRFEISLMGSTKMAHIGWNARDF